MEGEIDMANLSPLPCTSTVHNGRGSLYTAGVGVVLGLTVWHLGSRLSFAATGRPDPGTDLRVLERVLKGFRRALRLRPFKTSFRDPFRTFWGPGRIGNSGKSTDKGPCMSVC